MRARGSLAVLALLGACEADPAPSQVGTDGGGQGSSDAAVAVVCPDPGTPSSASDLVLGQSSPSGTSPNADGPSASSFYFPWGIASDGTRMWVADEYNARVLQWQALPTSNGEAADIALGQPSLSAIEPGRAANLMAHSATHVWVADGKLFVADAGNNRVLIWKTIPSSTGQAADLVLGQKDFSSLSSGTLAADLAQPQGVWSDGTRVVVADWGNHRVLIWNTLPTQNGQDADVVLGWSSFGLGRNAPAVSPPTAASLRGPQGVFSDGTRLLVADADNNRVLVWNTFPSSNGQAADVVLGQADFSHGSSNRGAPCPSAATLSIPSSVHVNGDTVAIADTGNHRVLIFDGIPSAPGAAAVAVLGQSGFVTNELGSASATRINSPEGVLVVGGQIYVSQPYWNRVSRFELPTAP